MAVEKVGEGADCDGHAEAADCRIEQKRSETLRMTLRSLSLVPNKARGRRGQKERELAQSLFDRVGVRHLLPAGDSRICPASGLQH